MKLIKKRELLSTNILDCTLRDGGYYNNWLFSNNLINEYIKFVERNNINYIEIGFRFFDEIRNKGIAAYSDLSFINSLKFQKHTSIGVMFNGSDIVKYKNNKKIIDYFSEILKSKKLSFIRIACHAKEIEKILFFTKKIKLNSKKIMINLMQISEIRKSQLKGICRKIKKLDPDVFYLADSLGSMKPNDFKMMVRQIKKFWHGDIGIHAHNNKKLALKNTLISNSSGARWLDCTLTGMGRGAGNTITEELLKKLKKNNFNKIDQKLINKFKVMKQKYKWGPNKIYEIAADYKIHPTYVQLLLTGKPFVEYRNNVLEVLKNLKTSSSKFEINKLYLALNKNSKKFKNNFDFLKGKKNKDILIIGSKDDLKNKLDKIIHYIKKNDLYVISLNNINKIEKNFCDIHVASHPLRIAADFNSYDKNKQYLLPFNMLNKKSIKKIPKNIFNANIKFGDNNFIKDKQIFELKTPLAIGYALQLALKVNPSKIYLYGFSDAYSDIYQKSKTSHNVFLKKKKKIKKSKLDGETKSILSDFKKQNKKISLNFIQF